MLHMPWMLLVAGVLFQIWLCSPCLDKYKERNYCPKCGVTYHEHDNMVQAIGCAACEFWVHASCEGLSTVRVVLLFVCGGGGVAALFGVAFG